jgi:murein DD-endopeptidase MepM/ murein hydrolase activator NlpD
VETRGLIRLATSLPTALLVVGFAGCASAPRSEVVSVPSGWPVDPRVATFSSSFGARRGGSWHQGIDLSAPKGTPVWATADGTVVAAERDGSYGRMVVIDHGNGFSTRYAHLKRIKAARGERVRRGDTLGTVGASGRASGSHLHYEVLRDGVPVDPRPFLGGG